MRDLKIQNIISEASGLIQTIIDDNNKFLLDAGMEKNISINPKDHGIHIDFENNTSEFRMGIDGELIDCMTGDSQDLNFINLWDAIETIIDEENCSKENCGCGLFIIHLN